MSTDPGTARLGRTVPALPVRDVAAAVADHAARFGFRAVHVSADFAVLVRDGAELHLWAATDERWRTRTDLVAAPVRSGAESFLAGTASCRIEVTGVDALLAELAPRGAVHPVARGAVTTTDHGTRELPCLDLDGNLLTFVERTG